MTVLFGTLAEGRGRAQAASLRATKSDLQGVPYNPMAAGPLLACNLAVYGLGGLLAPFVAIKLIDLAVSTLYLA